MDPQRPMQRFSSFLTLALCSTLLGGCQLFSEAPKTPVAAEERYDSKEEQLDDFFRRIYELQLSVSNSETQIAQIASQISRKVGAETGAELPVLKDLLRAKTAKAAEEGLYLSVSCPELPAPAEKIDLEESLSAVGDLQIQFYGRNAKHEEEKFFNSLELILKSSLSETYKMREADHLAKDHLSEAGILLGKLDSLVKNPLHTDDIRKNLESAKLLLPELRNRAFLLAERGDSLSDLLDYALNSLDLAPESTPGLPAKQNTLSLPLTPSAQPIQQHASPVAKPVKAKAASTSEETDFAP